VRQRPGPTRPGAPAPEPGAPGLPLAAACAGLGASAASGPGPGPPDSAAPRPQSWLDSTRMNHGCYRPSSLKTGISQPFHLSDSELTGCVPVLDCSRLSDHSTRRRRRFKILLSALGCTKPLHESGWHTDAYVQKPYQILSSARQLPSVLVLN
jgi:hypothetical protein